MRFAGFFQVRSHFIEKLCLVSTAYGCSVVAVEKLSPDQRSSSQKSSAYISLPFSLKMLFNKKYHVFCALLALFCASKNAIRVSIHSV